MIHIGIMMLGSLLVVMLFWLLPLEL